MSRRWTDLQVKILEGLIKQGLSASAIARSLSTSGTIISRNAVVGRAFRMGLILGGGVKYNRPPIARRNSKPAPKIIADPQFHRLGIMCDPVPPDAVTALSDLADAQCRWIAGHVGEGHGYCSQPQISNSSYCEAHHRRVYVGTAEHVRKAPDDLKRTLVLNRKLQDVEV